MTDAANPAPMMATKPSRIELFMTVLRVARWQTTLAWYIEALGLSPVLVDPAHEFALLAAGCGRVGLQGVKEAQAPTSRARVRLVFQVADLDVERRRLLDRGIAVGEPVANAAEGYREIRFQDPEGYSLRFFAWENPEPPVPSPVPASRGRLDLAAQNHDSRGTSAMRDVRVTWALGLVAFFFLGFGEKVVRAQKPAPVENVSTLPHRTPAEELKALHVPPGFEVQLVAAEPDIQKPLNIAFDDLGRLWVTDTVEYPFPKPPGTPGRDTVKVLSNFGPDGRARKVETFADGLNIPIGLLPYPSGRAVLVHNIPNIYLMTDTDGDGRADRREVLYGVIGHRDTHGMTNAFSWGFDGWVYACHGFANESRVQGKDHRPIEMQSGNTYRMRPTARMPSMSPTAR